MLGNSVTASWSNYQVITLDPGVFTPQVPEVHLYKYSKLALMTSDGYQAEIRLDIDPDGDSTLDCEDTIYNRQYILINTNAP